MTGYTSLLVKTGQTTKYVDGDDGDLEIGVARSFTTLDTGQYSGATDITLNGNTDAQSNNCIQDNVTGLMWMANLAGLAGIDYGKGATNYYPWTTDVNGIGVFAYCVAANAALLGGHGDWRVPNDIEAKSLINYDTGVPYSPWNYGFWTSNTSPLNNTNALYLAATGVASVDVKTGTYNVLLVRGTPTAPAAGGGSLISGMVG
jgi:hypothetical protein